MESRNFSFIFDTKMKIYYVYEHRTLEDQLFYVGKGTFNPKYSYGGYQRAYSKQNRNKKWKEFAKKGYIVNIIDESDDLITILQKENELWEDCSLCVNQQVNKTFNNYKLFKITEELYTLYIFKNTYLIFRSGDIFNVFGKKINPSDNGKGYKLITFTDGETIRKNMYVHRLIAECFVLNPDNLSVVNHKDLNRSNNSAENLEWLTQKQNIQHSVNLSSYVFKNKRKIIYQFTKDRQFIKEWDRALSAAQHFNCTEELIQQACSQKSTKCYTAKGYRWIYKEDYDINNLQKFNYSKNQQK